MKHAPIKMMVNGRYGRVPSGPSAFAKFSKKCRVREGVNTLAEDKKIGRYQSEILLNMANSDNETDVFIAEKAVDMRLKGLIDDEVSESSNQDDAGTNPANF